MPEMADIIRVHGATYKNKFGDNMLPSHRKAMRDITGCRTEVMGGRVYHCKKCNDSRYCYHSCKNRHCPKCGNDAATAWLDAQKALLLPGKYFLVTVTLPADLRKAARQNQKLIYGLLMRCAAQAIQKLARDPRFVGAELGIIAVLQTWAKDMHYHPHVHFIVTAGGLSADGKRWLCAQRDYLIPHKALAKIFRAKFRDVLRQANTTLFANVQNKVWLTDWVIDIRPVGNGTTALKYLAPYVFRVAISNKRIVNFKKGMVTFRYRDAKGKNQFKTLTAEAFITGFLQHVLPKRFVKLRYYGIFSPGKRHLLKTVKELFDHFEPESAKSTPEAQPEKTMRCPKCGTPMLFVRELLPLRRAP